MPNAGVETNNRYAQIYDDKKRVIEEEMDPVEQYFKAFKNKFNRYDANIIDKAIRYLEVKTGKFTDERLVDRIKDTPE